MENVENTYCRFCAEPKGAGKVLILQNDAEKCNEIHYKLAFVNALYVNVNKDDMLPKTICFVCYDSLNKAYEFLDKVKKAQEVLNNLFSLDESRGYSAQDEDNRASFDGYMSDEVTNDPPECVPDIKIKSPPKDHSSSNSVEIKLEFAEEADTNILEAISKEDSAHDDINVHDVLDAALNSDFALYAKDLSDFTKRDIKSWKDYPWVCAFCNIEFTNIDMLRSHSKIAHGKCSAFMCIDCKAVKTENFTSFFKHVRKHRKYLRSYCYYCHAEVDKNDSLSVHIKTHFIKPKVPCPLCGEILNHDDSLKCHLQEYSLTKRKRRPRRKPGTPITVEDLTCPLCNKVYKNPNSLRDHMKLHTKDRQRNYTCDRCGKMFFNKGTLTSHIMAHDNVRPHVCRICNKSFLYPNVLRRHVDMHTGVKPYSCDECGRCFRLPYQLKSHMIIHTDNMPYVCEYCNKAFRFKQILKNHERQHTGARPYSCKQCGMEFTNWSNYNKHMKRRHGMDESKKKITPEGVFPINPQTGQIMQVDDPDPVATVEWRKKIMLPAKRGKKKAIKEETS